MQQLKNYQKQTNAHTMHIIVLENSQIIKIKPSGCCFPPSNQSRIVFTLSHLALVSILTFLPCLTTLYMYKNNKLNLKVFTEITSKIEAKNHYTIVEFLDVLYQTIKKV